MPVAIGLIRCQRQLRHPRQRRQAHRLRPGPARVHRQARGAAAARRGLPPAPRPLPRQPPGRPYGSRTSRSPSDPPLPRAAERERVTPRCADAVKAAKAAPAPHPLAPWPRYSAFGLGQIVIRSIHVSIDEDPRPWVRAQSVGRWRGGRGGGGHGAQTEVVVTAQRRSERLADVPAAVAAIPADQARAVGAQKVSELADYAPNLAIQSNTPLGAAVVIRGVGSSSRNIGFDSRVGVYLDGVYLGSRRRWTRSCSTSSASRCCAGRRARCSARTPSPAPST